jgi:F0F1-type ATP synthase gamma subunit
MELKKIQRQIHSFSRFSDVLKAIQMVAASDMKSVKSNISKRFFGMVPFNTLIPFIAFLFKLSFFGLVFVIVLSIDKSCIGSHNFTIINVLLQYISSLACDGISCICFGWKTELILEEFTNNFFEYKSIVDEKVFDIGIFYYLICELGLFFSCIFIFFNRYFNSYSIEGKFFVFPGDFFFNLMIVINILSKGSSIVNVYNIFISVLVKNRISGDYYKVGSSFVIMHSYEDNIISYIANRISAMATSTKNVEEKHASLVLLYNKTRQEKITTEIIEICTHV